MYGIPPMMDRYGLGLPMGPAALVCIEVYASFFFVELEIQDRGC